MILKTNIAGMSVSINFLKIRQKNTPIIQQPYMKALSVTYEELNRKANQLAWHLQKKGVGPETLVGVSLDRSHSMIIALLGILKAGGAYVPLEPSFPPGAAGRGHSQCRDHYCYFPRDKHLGAV